MDMYCYRLTKTRKFVLNNRWKNVIVRPKETLFFIDCDQEQIENWKTFLCEKHSKDHLFLHEVQLYYISRGLKRRRFSNKYNLNEIMLKADCFNTAKVRKTIKVFKNIPINFKYMKRAKPKIDIEENDDILDDVIDLFSRRRKRR